MTQRSATDGPNNEHEVHMPCQSLIDPKGWRIIMNKVLLTLALVASPTLAEESKPVATQVG
jgi:hypothetical protein